MIPHIELYLDCFVRVTALLEYLDFFQPHPSFLVYPFPPPIEIFHLHSNKNRHRNSSIIIPFFFFVFFPGLDGLPLPTTHSTKKARAGQLNKKNQIAESLKVPVLINAAHLKRGIRGAMRDGPTSTYAHCN